MGRLRADPETVVFFAAKAVKGNLGKMAVHEISLADMRVAEKFAREIGDELNEFNRKQIAPNAKPPPEPPEFR